MTLLIRCDDCGDFHGEPADDRCVVRLRDRVHELETRLNQVTSALQVAGRLLVGDEDAQSSIRAVLNAYGLCEEKDKRKRRRR